MDGGAGVPHRELEKVAGAASESVPLAASASGAWTVESPPRPGSVEEGGAKMAVGDEFDTPTPPEKDTSTPRPNTHLRFAREVLTRLASVVAAKSSPRPQSAGGREATMEEEDGFRTTPPPPDEAFKRSLLAFVKDHITLLVSISSALIFAFRCAAVSGGNRSVAFILVTETSVGVAIRALLLTLVPFVLALASNAIGFVIVVRIIKGRWRNLETLLLLLIAPLVYLAGVIILAEPMTQDFVMLTFSSSWGVIWLATFPAAAIFKSQRIKLIVGALVFTFFTVQLFIVSSNPLENALFGDRVWLAPERLDFKGEAPFTGYVLNVSEDQLVIMRHKPRIIFRIPKAALEDRDFCYTTQYRISINKRLSPPNCP